MKSPVMSSSVACPRPTSLGRSQEAPMSAPDSPTRTKRNAIFAVSDATRMSHAEAITAPAPATVPFNAAITGFRHRRMFRIRSQVMSVKRRRPAASSEKSAPMMSSTSPPEQKARPAPVSTTARTAGSLSTAGKRSRSSEYTSKVRAFSRSGRLRVTVATPVSALTAKRNDLGAGVKLRLPREHSRGLDLDDRAHIHEPAHLEKRHGGIVLPQPRPPSLAQGLPARAVCREVGDVDREPCQVGGLAPRLAEDGDHLVERAAELAGEVGRLPARALFPACLPGDEEKTSSARCQEPVVPPFRSAEGFRIDDLESHEAGTPPGFRTIDSPLRSLPAMQSSITAAATSS